MWNKKEMSQLDATLTRVPLTLTFDLEFSRSNCISGMGGSIVMERKGQEWLGCPDVKHNLNHYVTMRQRILLPTGWLKMSAFPSTGLVHIYFSGLAQDSSISTANAVEILQSCAKQPLWIQLHVTLGHQLFSCHHLFISGMMTDNQQQPIMWYNADLSSMILWKQKMNWISLLDHVDIFLLFPAWAQKG